MRIDIDVTIKTERELSAEEQEYHEFWIDQFKHHFDEWFCQSGLPKSNSIHFNVDYLADFRKFKITHISQQEEQILSRIRNDYSFYNRYFQL